MRSWLAIIVCVAVSGCRNAPPPPAVGEVSPRGWEVRYNAALALAHRGSDQFLQSDVQDIVKEMLDEPQQLSNFRTTLKDGRQVRDSATARTAILGALKAIADYRVKKPSADLSGLRPALDKLAASENPVLAKEARVLREAMAPRGSEG